MKDVINSKAAQAACLLVQPGRGQKVNFLKYLCKTPSLSFLSTGSNPRAASFQGGGLPASE
ncbi:hypothetical protein, partial [Klebsiella pneumoniae]|uniref:hypothetical protein n=1 Tax=Klebsiella pneumoniae TaxID=573 RepID=UPI003EB89801